MRIWYKKKYIQIKGGILMKKEITMNGLKKCFQGAKDKQAIYVAVRVTVPDGATTEVIINDYHNIDVKLNYYMKAYNDDLTLKSFPKIKIINFAYGNSYTDIRNSI
jgi:hypothetical protein